MDRIGALPDDLLLQILAGLDCARAAARTGLVARRWRGLWARLPELAFRDLNPGSLDAALAQVARPALSLLSIRFPDGQRLGSAAISSLLHAAAKLTPARFSIHVAGDPLTGEVELPCFNRTDSITLHVSGGLDVSLLPEANFPMLVELSLNCNHIDIGDLLTHCPRLCKLCLSNAWLDSLRIDSPSLEELRVYVFRRLQHIDIVTPALKKFKLFAIDGIGDEFSMSFSAPLVEELSWACLYPYFNVGFGQIWRLGKLILRTSEAAGKMQLAVNREKTNLKLRRALSLCLGTGIILGDAERSFGQVISQTPVTNFSILNLEIKAGQHVYGAMVVHLLGLCTSIQRLEVKLLEVQFETRSVNCPCDQPNSWSSQTISLTNLKEVEINGFGGEVHEVDLLEVIFRSATVLKRVIVHLSSKVSASDSVYIKIHSILKAHPSVECKVYGWSI
ncbi:hypothetical protein ACP70R_023063 [Stipagrostis hirtigluma subsp. patula]